jgi:hypothetical protein
LRFESSQQQPDEPSLVVAQLPDGEVRAGLETKKAQTDRRLPEEPVFFSP